MKKLVVIFLSFVLLSSCGKSDVVGDWDDNIKLSANTAEFGAKADSVLISTEGDSWMIATVYFNDTAYSGYYRDDIDFESYPYSIVGDNFVVERRDKNTLFVKLDENETGEERTMGIVLNDWNYFDQVVIKQSAQ